MRLANIGCGGVRPQGEEWINVDSLRSQLALGTPERTNLDNEKNYVDHDLLQPWPFPDNHFDGVAMVHLIEHFNCHDAVKVLKEARRCLASGGLLLASVPDASYFWTVRHRDKKINAEHIFGEPIHDEGHETFRSYALFRHDHVQLLTTDAVKCLLLEAEYSEISDWNDSMVGLYEPQTAAALCGMLNRRKFSLEMIAIK